MAKNSGMSSDAIAISARPGIPAIAPEWSGKIALKGDLADARARLAAADKQLAYTVVHAPMAGRVAERPVAAGDVVPAGATLYVLVDPASMRLEAAVPAAELPRVQAGAADLEQVLGPMTGPVMAVRPPVRPGARAARVFHTWGNPKSRRPAGAEKSISSGFVQP